ncbi:histidine kinase [Pseudonocardia sp. CNS-139]|nr:histidine kinase [Pseudonocardia sp. CNS-139]
MPPPASDVWSEVAEHAPDGLAVVDDDGRFVQLNAAAAALCGGTPAGLAGCVSPFPPGAEQAAEQVVPFCPAPGVRRELAYRARPLPGGDGRTVVAFRDVTDERTRERRAAAVARAAAELAAQRSITATLDALARELLQADALAGVQILTTDEDGRGLQIMGSAGFPRRPDFFERLMECRARGGTLAMTEALDKQEPVVIPDRWDAIRDDPAWEPIRGYLGELEWNSFASVPLIVRGRAAGVLNAFFAPGQDVGPRVVEFLTAMAEQAAVALDYADLLQKERALVRREERQRLARDLHDSIVQQVFSIGMQAETMSVVGGRGTDVPAASVLRVAGEIGALARTVLADLRAMVHELRPDAAAQLGLAEAVRALADSTAGRTGLHVDLRVGNGLDRAGPELAEDVYRIVAEAVHNVVKHAEASAVTVRIGVRDHRLAVSVADDGVGLRATREPGRPGGYGLTSMRERAQRWGGSVRVGPRPGRPGTVVRAAVPLPVTVRPAAGGG